MGRFCTTARWIWEVYCHWECVWTFLQTLATLMSIGSTGAGLHSTKDLKANCVQQAQKAIHENPELMTNWCSLLSALYADEVKNQDNAGTKDKKELHNYAISLGTHLLSKGRINIFFNWLAPLYLWQVELIWWGGFMSSSSLSWSVNLCLK